MSLRLSLKIVFAVLVASAALLVGSAAGAAPNPDYTAPAPTSVVNNSTPREGGGAQTARASRATPAAVAAAPGRTQMAITGSDVGQLALIGGVLLAGGAATMALRRRSLSV